MLHCPEAFLVSVPLKITSEMESPRKFFADNYPSTHLTASMILDLQQPLGPTTATIFVGKDIRVESTKLLKPANFRCLSCMS